ncbi:Cof-type HAD-IIB family hydrolase [Ornithinibacillus scapharcae]|uniref:Cof-type HAD-IIB family hydrolase n=1 Tax=Ornithinibacillus scapharcae TaxID=1147159 RepID=UPI000225B2B3|nr:Cof-type HAD-IIB family hydrolase [Ornithinibacillus scapharcae]
MKLIALDLDGTTFNSNKEISKENIEAIKLAQAEGHKVMVLSGRALDEITPDLEKYGLHCPIGTNNGASIYINNQAVKMITLEQEQIKAITTEVEQEYIPYTVATNNGVYAPKDWFQRLENMLPSSGTDKEELEMYKAFALAYGHQSFHHIHDLLNDATIQIQKFFAFTIDPIQKKRFEMFLNTIDGISIVSTNTFIDIMHHQASKGNALQFMAEYYQIPLKDTVAIGDEGNDISMFNIAGLAIAMGNARDQVKKHSDVVTLTNDEHGVAHAIHHYVLHETIKN